MSQGLCFVSALITEQEMKEGRMWHMTFKAHSEDRWMQVVFYLWNIAVLIYWRSHSSPAAAHAAGWQTQSHLQVSGHWSGLRAQLCGGWSSQPLYMAGGGVLLRPEDRTFSCLSSPTPVRRVRSSDLPGASDRTLTVCLLIFPASSFFYSSLNS